MIPVFPTYVFVDDSTLTRKSMNNVIRSQTEVGPAKTRPIQATPMIQVSFTASVCDDKFDDWTTWFADEIAFGAKWFRMYDPIFGERQRFRFVETEIEWTKLGNIYQADFVIEAY